MLSKNKILHGRGNLVDVANDTNVHLESTTLDKNVELTREGICAATQVEEFLLSEYFKNDEFLNLSCWDICSIYSGQQMSSKTDSNMSDGGRPITALALMFLSQYSSLPRTIKNR